MRSTLFILSVILGGCLAIATSVRAEYPNSSQYLINKYSNGPVALPLANIIDNTVSTNSFQSQQLITPKGAYLITKSGNTTYIIQTGKTK